VYYADRDLLILWCIDRARGDGPKKIVIIYETGLRWEYICAALRRMRAQRLVVRTDSGLELTAAGRDRLHLSAAVAVTAAGRFAVVSHSEMTISERAEAAIELVEDDAARVALEPITLAPEDKRAIRGPRNVSDVLRCSTCGRYYRRGLVCEHSEEGTDG